MLDIPSITGIVATVGVLVGVALAYLEIRNLVRTRQTDMVIRIYSAVGTREWNEAWEKFKNREIMDYNGYLRKYGFKEVNQAATVFEAVGILLHRKLIDVSLVYDLLGSAATVIWEKVKRLAEQVRKQQNRPDVWMWLEYLYNEMQKREQELASKTA